MAKRVDGIVDAVRFSNEGEIEFVRVYKRRGAVFSDRILLSRGELIDQLRKRKRYFTGTRKPLMGTTFAVGEAVKLSGKKEATRVIVGNAASESDSLPGVPRI